MLELLKIAKLQDEVRTLNDVISLMIFKLSKNNRFTFSKEDFVELSEKAGGYIQYLHKNGSLVFVGYNNDDEEKAAELEAKQNVYTGEDEKPKQEDDSLDSLAEELAKILKKMAR